MYQTLRSSGGLSYNAVEKAFEDHQGKWSEAIFNEDAWFKYIDPLINDGNGAYLEMMQGSKKEQRKWWLYNRFRYIDSKYNAGDALSDVIQLRGYAKANITVIPYADIYPTVKYGSYLVHERGKRGVATTLLNPLDNVNDTEIYIYSSSQLASVGDLSGLLVGFADFSMATKLQSLKIGSDATGYSNTNLKTLTLGNNVLLKTIDVRNCVGLGTGDQKAVDISGCTNIEEIYFDGTNITGLQLPNGGIIKKLHLPATVTNLTIMNQKSITEFVMPSYANITTLRLENVSTAIDMFDILDAIQANSRIRLIGFYIEAQNAQEISELFDIFDKMRGLDEQGNNTEKAQVSGEIHTASLTGAEIAEFNSRYSYVRVTADHTSAILTYKTYDGASVLFTETVLDGGNGTKVNTTARTSTAQYSYTPDGWATEPNGSKDANALANVVADRTVYASYIATLRKYTVTFVRASADGGGTLQTMNNVPYGTTVTASSAYTGTTPTSTQGSATDYPFKGWNPASATVQGNTIFTAKFGSPVDVSEISDSWDAIIASIDTGTYATKYKLGQYKPLDLGTEGTINMQIVAMDADELADGSGTAPMTFVAMELLNTKQNVRLYDTGGWKQSTVRTYIGNTIYNLVPLNVRVRINKVYKISNSSGNSSMNTEDLLWIPSLHELGFTSSGTYSERNGVAYTQIYTDDTSRIKGINNVSTVYVTRSSGVNSNYPTYAVNVDGTSTWQRNELGICLGFCLGSERETISDSWDTILANQHTSVSYKIGDTKWMELSSGEKVLMQIVGFSCDELADGNGLARISWLSKYLLNDTHNMNPSRTTQGGWEASGIRTYLNDTIKPMLPDNIRNGIQIVNKYSGSYQIAQTTQDSVWIPSFKEMFNRTTEYEQSGVSYSNAFTNNTSRAKRRRTDAFYREYWLRTVYSDTNFYNVRTTGGSDYMGASNPYGIALGFCTGATAIPEDITYMLGEATSFNGSSTYLDTRLQLMNGRNSFTIVFDCLDTIQPVNTMQYALLHCMHETSPWLGFALQEKRTSNNIAYSIDFNFSSSNQYITVDGGAYNNNRRVKMVIAVDYTLNKMTVYSDVNGTAKTDEINIPSGTTTVSETTLIGCYQDTNGNKGRYWKGTMYDLKIHNHAFTSTEAQAYLAEDHR